MRKKRGGWTATFRCSEAKRAKEAEETLLSVSGPALENLAQTVEISVIVEVVQ